MAEGTKRAFGLCGGAGSDLKAELPISAVEESLGMEMPFSLQPYRTSSHAKLLDELFGASHGLKHHGLQLQTLCSYSTQAVGRSITLPRALAVLGAVEWQSTPRFLHGPPAWANTWHRRLGGGAGDPKWIGNQAGSSSRFLRALNKINGRWGSCECGIIAPGGAWLF